ncbi:UDP-N-acetyl-D-mannosamine dehydrogenase [Sphingomonas panacisoli]|uniref:UDP-N-acetyl-D-mannosamine dehydrogenase n=1 Tax=Sphingomonas panacisoli TaxID=1813879 RepID=A0A5B8LIG4_9SPHN|nr:UDP-N-acetyl-D-mannosamine dehydrogenase [Sphingomonas panacisoli]QDZ06940.1 UDP-N-acetyl-D-mannosamine dehydrogenase [Sphingomonas panacisoli]
MSIATVSVIGLGYIGLPTAAILASSGCQVIGVDISEHAVATINDGRAHIVEPGLGALIASTVGQGALRATLIAEPADAFMIAVPTPFKGDHEPDLAYVKSACDTIAPVLKKGDTVILESTSPVGATEQVAKWLAAARPDLVIPTARSQDEFTDIAIAYCPERVLPGNVLIELVKNDRVIGGLTPACSEAAKRVYALFVKGEIILTDARTAEMCKLAENSFRDVNIAFANELSIVCDRLDIDVWELIALANRHPRVDILQPGPGVGGHCIAVDPWFIVHSSRDQARLIRKAREVNDAKPDWVIDKVCAAVDEVRAARGTDENVRIACLGLAFKRDIDDLRESPALAICERLADLPGCDVIAVEPNIDALPKQLAGRVVLENVDVAIGVADVILLLVDHHQFGDAYRLVDTRVPVIDTRGLWRERRDVRRENAAAHEPVDTMKMAVGDLDQSMARP